MNKLHAALLALAVIAASDLQAQVLQVETKAGVQDFAARTGGPARTWDAGYSLNSVFPLPSDLPDPQIAVGPADVFTVVSSTLSRYPNPNFAGATASANPTFQVSIQAFLNSVVGSLCSPNPTMFTCVIINTTVRYDQMQGRFVLVTTATDVPSKRSNFVLAVSNGSTIGNGFTGFSFYTIPLNVTAGSTTTISAGGSSYPFVSVPFCGVGPGPCTDYFPTSARLGLDNDNIILTAPVLDFSGETGTGGMLPLPFSGQNFGGPYAGTRVVTIPKALVYNPHPNSAVAGAQPGDGCIASNACGAINLADNPTTGTLTGPGPQVFWEPDNLRGRALASFDSQLTHTAFTPVDYLAGAPITDWLTNQTSTATNQTLYLQPIRFVCPGTGLTCPVELPVLGSTRSLTTFHSFSDPLPVGQSNSVSADNESHSRLFVGDSRPQQVIFREGLLYLARAVRSYDSGGNALGTSMVSYDIFHPGDTAPWLNAGWLTSLTAPNSTAFGFYAPMFDVPANVDSPGAGPYGSPVNITPFLQNLFVGMTTGNGSTLGPFDTNYPSLWDFRPGDDAYDTPVPYVDPVTGAYPSQLTCAPVDCQLIPFGNRGSASTDPNDGSLWVFGEFAKPRLAIVPGPGQWGTALANYPLSFPATDPYGSGSTPFSDVPAGYPFFPLVQIAKNYGTVLAGQTTTAYGTCPAAPVVNPPVTSAPKVTCSYFKPAASATRSDLVRGIVLGQMDDAQVSSYLAATGGTWPSFIDTVYDPNFRYIEVAYRRGYIQACGGRIGQLNFCPDQPVTYGDAATAIIRAKLGNVFSLPPVSNPFPYMQQLEQLQITAGTAKHYYSDKLTREEIAIYTTRAFFL